MSDIEEKITLAVERLAILATQNGDTVATAESCTGGALAAVLTELPGASAWFKEGCVTYTNEAKMRLGVSPKALDRHGAVSETVAQMMARCITASSGAKVGVGITGLAGPGGGTIDKPVGTVCIAWAEHFNEHIMTCSRTIHVSGSRHYVRQVAILTAIEGMCEIMRYGMHPAMMPCEF